MGIQAMHNNTVFLHSAGCVDWSSVEDSTSWGFKASNAPFCISGAVMGFLNSAEVGKTLTQRKNWSNPIYPSRPSSSKPTYLYHTCSTTQCHKIYLEWPQRVET